MIGASLKLTGSLSVITQIAVLLEEHGFSDAINMDAPASHAVVPTQGGIAPQPVITPAAATAAASAGVELDAKGLPWDERIHSSNKAKKADGSWHKRKGLADGVFEQVEAELRAQYPNVPTAGAASAPTALPVAVANPAPEPVAAPQPVPVGVQPTMAAITPPLQPQPVPMTVPTPPAEPLPVPVAAPQPVTPPQPVAPVLTGPPTNLMELMSALTPLMPPTGSVTPEYLHGVLNETNTAWAAQLGGTVFNGIADIAARPDLPIAGYIWQILQRDGHAPA